MIKQRKHALFSPSSSYRWKECAASVAMEHLSVEAGLISFDHTNDDAMLGTAAHSLAEWCLHTGSWPHHYPVKFIDVVNYEDNTIKSFPVDQRMKDGVRMFLRECRKRVVKSDGILYSEKKVKMTNYIPKGFGTSDCFIIPKDGHKLYILDYKNGYIPITAINNPQIRIYALGVLQTFKRLTKKITEVEMVIVQPNVSTERITFETLSVNELHEWGRSELKEQVKTANTLYRFRKFRRIPLHHFNPSYETCKWCLAELCRYKIEELPKMSKHKAKGREIVLDTETTGFDVTTGQRICDIGMVELIDGRQSGRTWQRYLNPQTPVQPGALRVHGLTDEFLADKPTFAEVVDDFLKFIGKDSKLIIHNASFDMAFINWQLRYLGLPAIEDDRIIDSLAIAKSKYPNEKSHKLDHLIDIFNISEEGRGKHSALEDCYLLAGVYEKLIQDDPDRKPPISEHDRSVHNAFAEAMGASGEGGNEAIIP